MSTGECPFVVHGLTGEQYDKKSWDERIGEAIKHWSNGGAALRVSHKEEPESIYRNPGLYPQIFPWLFPYGLGGIGSTNLSKKLHKKQLLMYHDKRFQMDPLFPFVAFNYQQMKDVSSGSFFTCQNCKI